MTTTEETPPTSINQDEPTTEPASVVNAFKWQHAKVIRFELSVGKDDSDRTIEQFEAEIREALSLVRANHVTQQGGYYIIDGSVCAIADYDPTTKNRRPGTYAPQWAGGPKSGTKPIEDVYLPDTVTTSVAQPAEPVDAVTKEQTVKELAQKMVTQTKRRK